MLFSVAVVQARRESLHDALSLSPSLLKDFSCDDVCVFGACAQCNDVCFDNKEGNCAQCWEVNQTIGVACLSASSQEPDCRPCWQYSPCALCRTGSCARCEACQQSKEGDCASCWEADSNNFTCLLGYEGKDCKGCWNINSAAPIVITSGFTASTLVATWKGVPLCKDSLTPTVVWPFSDSLSITDVLCYTKLLRVSFDPATNTFHNLAGVNVSVVDFGGLDGLSFGSALGVFDSYGYREGVNMFGAPFDWRQAAQGLDQLYSDLQALIEKVYASTKQRISLLAPSYGPQVMLGFLQLMTQEWKDEHLGWFVASSPVWSGSTTALYAVTAGLSLAPNSTDAINRAFRDFEVQLPGMVWLSPQPGQDNFTFPSSMPLVTTPTQNYSAADLSKVLAGVGYDSSISEAQYLQRSGPLFKFQPPLVNTWINYGYLVSTMLSFSLEDPLSSSEMPKLLNLTLGSGDGIVALRSSLRGVLWEDAHKQANKKLIHSGYSEMGHAACLLPFIDYNHTDCFYDLISLLINGTLPNPTPPPEV